MDKPFGGKTVLLGGDFRQILPVLPKKGREDIVMASINRSYLWNYYKIFILEQNMRLEANVPPVSLDGITIPFADWVIRIGDGAEHATSLDNVNDPTWIHNPPELTLPPHNRGIRYLINVLHSVYPTSTQTRNI